MLKYNMEYLTLCIFYRKCLTCVINKRDVRCCKDMHSIPKRKFDEFNELTHLLKPGLQIPLDADAALCLFFELNDLVARIEQD